MKAILWTAIAAAVVGPLAAGASAAPGVPEGKSASALTLDFGIGGLAPSADGARLVVYGYVGNDMASPPVHSGRIALIDAKAGRVLATRQFDAPVTAVAIDSRNVFVAIGPRVEALKLPDLSRQDFVLGPPVRALHCVADKWLVAVSNESVTVRALPGLKPAPTPLDLLRDAGDPDRRAVLRGLRGSRLKREGVSLGERALENGWFIGGYVFGDDLTTVRGIQDPTAVAPLHIRRPLTGQGPTPWNRELVDQRLRTGDRIDVVTFPSKGALCLRNHPLAAGFLASNPSQGLFQADVVFRQLVTGEALATRPVVPPVNQAEWNLLGLHYDPVPRMADTHDTLFVASGKTLFFCPIKPASLGEYPRPLRLEYPAAVPVVPTTQTLPLPHKALGGTPPYSFELTCQSDGLQLDPATGQLTVEGPALATEAVEALLSAVSEESGGSRTLPEPAAIQKAIAREQQWAATLLGRKLAGAPVLLGVSLRATDAQGQRASIDYYLVLDVPSEALAARVESIAAVIRRRKEEFEAAQAALGQPAAPDPQIQVRMTRLERRIEDLETKLDLLTRLLSKRAATRPDTPR